MKKTLLLLLLLLPLLTNCLIPAPEERLTVLQEKAAMKMEQYYTDGSGWYSCALLLRKIERLEKRLILQQ